MLHILGIRRVDTKNHVIGLSLLGTDRWRLPWNRIWGYRILIFGNIGNETWRNTETPRFNILWFVLIHCRSPELAEKPHWKNKVNSPSQASGLQWINRPKKSKALPRPVSAQSNSWLIGSLRAIWVIYGHINIYISDLSLSTTMTCWPSALHYSSRPKNALHEGTPVCQTGFHIKHEEKTQRILWKALAIDHLLSS